MDLKNKSMRLSKCNNEPKLCACPIQNTKDSKVLILRDLFIPFYKYVNCSSPAIYTIRRRTLQCNIFDGQPN